MLPIIYTLSNLESGKLSVMAKPVSGEWIEDEFIGFNRLGINLIVSLIEKHEEIELGLTREAELCSQNNIEFVSFPIPDRGIPNYKQAMNLADSLATKINNSAHVAIHCRAGIGRTGIIAAAVLIKLGVSPQEALHQISVTRGVQIPDTVEQEKWVLALE